MNKPKPVTTLVPNEPIILTKDQWDLVVSKTYDASIPFKVEITVMDKENDTIVGDVSNLAIEEGVDESKEEEPYVPRKVRKSKNK
jgi:hypothetical protein